MKNLDCYVMLLLVLGGINWGLWSIFELNLVDYIFGRTWIERVLYFLIGASAVYAAFSWKSLCSKAKR